MFRLTILPNHWQAVPLHRGHLMTVSPLILSFRVSLLILIYVVLLSGHAVPSRADSLRVDLGEIPTINPETTNGLQAFFQALDYNWAELEEGVPPLILENIPDDINRTASAKAKKHAFFMCLLPMKDHLTS